MTYEHQTDRGGGQLTPAPIGYFVTAWQPEVEGYRGYRFYSPRQSKRSKTEHMTLAEANVAADFVRSLGYLRDASTVPVIGPGRLLDDAFLELSEPEAEGIFNVEYGSFGRIDGWLEDFPLSAGGVYIPTCASTSSTANLEPCGPPFDEEGHPAESTVDPESEEATVRKFNDEAAAIFAEQVQLENELYAGGLLGCESASCLRNEENPPA